MDQALNNLQWLICHKTKTNQTNLLLIHLSLNNLTQRQLFTQNLTGLNSEFLLLYTSCNTKIKKSSLPYYISTMWATSRFISDLNSGPYTDFPYQLYLLIKCCVQNCIKQQKFSSIYLDHYQYKIMKSDSNYREKYG